MKNKMQRTTLWAIVGALLLLPSGPMAAQQAPVTQGSEESPNELFVTAGKSVLVNSALPIERVAVGFGDAAEALVISPQEVLVNGKAAGETTLIIWQRGGGKLYFDVTVQPNRTVATNRIDGIRRELNREMQGQQVSVTMEGDTLFVRGRVKDLTSAQRALAIAGSLGKTVNLLYVDVPEVEAQILLKVRFASVDRSLSNQLGMNLFSTGATNTVGSTTTGQFSPPSAPTLKTTSPSPGRGIAATTNLSSALNLFLFRPDLNLGATIQALEAKGILQTLAEPNVLAQNGRQASFLAGGEFPFPTVQGGTTGSAVAITVQFREFGIRLNFIPTIQPRGTIRLQVAPEVSSLDFTNGLNLNGFTIPSLSVRKVNTEVELAEGQSFAIGGLLDNRMTENLSKIPFLGDLPVLGKFFQSMSRSKQNTELIVIVTPELVRPIPAGKALPEVNYPRAFLPPNTGKPLETPGMSVTGPVPVTPPTPSIPAEDLMKSLEPEQPLNLLGTFGAQVNVQRGQVTSNAPASPPAPAAAPGPAPAR